MTAVVVAVEDKAIAGENRCVDFIGTIVENALLPSLSFFMEIQDSTALT